MPRPLSVSISTTMNDDPTSTPEDTLDDLALRHVLGTLDEGERAQFQTFLDSPHSRAATLAADYEEVAGAITLAAFGKGEMPRVELKVRVLAAVRARNAGASPPKTAAATVPPHAAALLKNSETQRWMATPYRGVRVRELSATRDQAILMLACAAGATFPPHDHAGTEDVYILSGDATLDGRTLRAGDFLHAAPGSHHHDMFSPSGCEALIITSRKNYSPLAARSYDVAHRVVSRIGQALGVGAGK